MGTDGRDRGIRLLSRRLRQARMILTSPGLGRPESIQADMIDRYASNPEIDFYATTIEQGLVPCEEAAVQWLKNSSASKGSALVVGCGAGREAVALEQMGFAVTGVDICPQMIETAQRLAKARGSRSRFLVLDVTAQDLNEKFDFIMVSLSIANHIKGRSKRINFWGSLREILSTKGILAHAPIVEKHTALSRYFLASMMLRFRWMGSGWWESGDTALSYLGNHNTTDEMVFFHHYQSKDDFISEVREAGLSVLQEVLEPMWLLVSENPNRPVADSSLKPSSFQESEPQNPTQT